MKKIIICLMLFFITYSFSFSNYEKSIDNSLKIDSIIRQFEDILSKQENEEYIREKLEKYMKNILTEKYWENFSYSDIETFKDIVYMNIYWYLKKWLKTPEKEPYILENETIKILIFWIHDWDIDLKIDEKWVYYERYTNDVIKKYYTFYIYNIAWVTDIEWYLNDNFLYEDCSITYKSNSWSSRFTKNDWYYSQSSNLLHWYCWENSWVYTLLWDDKLLILKYTWEYIWIDFNLIEEK